MPRARVRPTYPLLIEVGQIIRYHRQAHGWTMKNLAKKSRLALSYIKLVELGKTNPGVFPLAKICVALSIDFKELVPNHTLSYGALRLKKRMGLSQRVKSI